MQSKTDGPLDVTRLDLAAFDAEDFAQKFRFETAIWHAAIVALQERCKKDKQIVEDVDELKEQVLGLEDALKDSQAVAERRALRLAS